jgi:CRISPR-associated DxTHG motif protein
LYETFTRVAEAARPGGQGEDLKILLDTSHGVNYFTITVREAVFEAAAMLSMARASPVELRVYSTGPPPERRVVRSQSDPCAPASSEEPPEIDIYLLYKEKVHPWGLVDYLAYTDLNTVVKQADKNFEKDAEELNSQWRGELGRRAKQLVASLRVAAAPVLVILAKEVLCGNGFLNKMREFADKVYRTFLDSIRIMERGNTIAVRPGIMLMDGFRALLHAVAIAEGVKSAVGPLGCKGSASLEEVKRVRDRLLKGSKIAVELVDREIAKIRDDPTGTIKSARMFCDRYDRADSSVLVRDFVAHAGFDYCLLYYDTRCEAWSFRKDKVSKVYEVLDKIAEKLTK